MLELYNREMMGQREFATWLESKFVSWMGETGKRRTLTDFAKYLGVSQSLLSHWLNGRYLPDRQNVSKIAERLGSEVYDLLGLQRPDPDIQWLVKLFGELDAQGKEELLQAAEQIKQRRSMG